MRVAWVAHREADGDTGGKAARFMESILPPGSYEMSGSDPDILLFMSGGSERRALELAAAGRPLLLLSIPGNNAYAAATEVMARMTADRCFALLSDAREARDSGLAGAWCQVVEGWRTLEGSRAGLVGSVSEWLVASAVPPEILRERFGVALVTLPWNDLPGYAALTPDESLLQRWAPERTAELEEAARVLTLLRGVVAAHELEALAVECFSLVRRQRVTACLALAQLNAEGTPAACEGDLASLAGMMLAKKLTGTVPWMANTTRLTGNRLLLSHCTAGFDLLSAMALDTHFETGCSLAVNGRIASDDFTLFRLSEMLDSAFIAEGRTMERPALENACRTQLEIGIKPDAAELLKRQPLGNHLLLIPGKRGELLNLACRYRSVSIIS